jgi:2-oxoglutarate dehydrogenase E2 component (dihydrolipoamide succinyltransferase)
MGESVVEGTVARWLKAAGEPVAQLEPLLEISTDKIDTEVPSPAAGTLLAVVVAAGTTVRAGTVLAYIGDKGETLADEASVRPAQLVREAAATATAATTPSASDRPASHRQDRPAGRDYISPVVGRMVQEHDLDLAHIAGSGLNGRVTKRDVLAHLAQHREPTQPPAPTLAIDDEQRTPLTAMRRMIAEHMVRSKATSPHVTTIFEADMTAVVRHREAHKADYAARGVRLTYTPYFVAAAAQALRSAPEVNARFVGSGADSALIMASHIHIGVAVALPQGLIVPVIRDADERSLQGLARAISSLAEEARRGTLAPDALQGGTFTVTNHGVGGSLLGTPIIHQPQSAILGVGAIVKRAVVRAAGSSLLPSADDAIVIRPICYLSLSFDHRVLDGARADEFMRVVVQQLEGWSPDAA